MYIPMQFFDSIPHWAFFASSILVALLFKEIGFRTGTHHRNQGDKQNETFVNSMIGPTLGLLAFMLAFTFGIATARFEDRRQLVTQDANAILTAYLRADLLEQPYCDNVKNIFRKYIQVRANGANAGHGMPAVALANAIPEHSALWEQAVIVGQKHPESQTVALFIDSLNQVIELHSRRFVARLYSRVPQSIFITLFVIASLAMYGVGYQCGVTGKRNWPASMMLILTFSTVLLLVMDLDRPWEGFVVTNQQPMVDLARRLNIDASDK